MHLKKQLLKLNISKFYYMEIHYNIYQYQISGQARGHISNCPINEESTKGIENIIQSNLY